MRIHLTYASHTGNTKALAQAIGDKVGMKPLSLADHPPKPAPGDLVLHGFWTEEGDADQASIAFLEDLSGVTLGLFGTASYRSDGAYYDAILDQVKTHIKDDVRVLPGFMCLGKEPASIAKDLEVAIKKNPADLLSVARLRAYQNAKDHPNATDFHSVISWAQFLIEKNSP